jgi:hypothetical protein
MSAGYTPQRVTHRQPVLVKRTSCSSAWAEGAVIRNDEMNAPFYSMMYALLWLTTYISLWTSIFASLFTIKY